MTDVLGAVLARYPFLSAPRIESLGSGGGMSGARLWRLHTSGGSLCLRAAAPRERPEHLPWRHRLMQAARAMGLLFVPAVQVTTCGQTHVQVGGRAWELLQWLPGRATYREAPTLAKLRAAAQAIARIHLAWAAQTQVDSCPAVVRRLEAAREPLPFVGIGHDPTLMALAQRAAGLLARYQGTIPTLLEPFAHLRCRLQPCLRDVWHDHLLYEGETLTGLVDYAAVEMDTPATDLARLLGSLVGDDDSGWAEGLRAYREVRGLSAEDERLARLLDRTGAVLALQTWLRRLSRDEVPTEHESAVKQRFGELCRRVEGWRSV